MRRLVGCAAAVVVAVLCVASPAGAWSWPLQGEVLRPFSLGADAYAEGQHRGIDVGGSADEPVLSPVDGTVTFVGVVPTHGRVISLLTSDGLSVTVAHLGSASVIRGERVIEGAAIGGAGSSGVSEHPVPYVHLGVRLASAAQGYLDPARYLPPRVVAGPDHTAPAPVPAPVIVPVAGPASDTPAAAEPGDTVAPVASGPAAAPLPGGFGEVFPASAMPEAPLRRTSVAPRSPRPAPVTGAAAQRGLPERVAVSIGSDRHGAAPSSTRAGARSTREALVDRSRGSVSGVRRTSLPSRALRPAALAPSGAGSPIPRDGPGSDHLARSLLGQVRVADVPEPRDAIAVSASRQAATNRSSEPTTSSVVGRLVGSGAAILWRLLLVGASCVLLVMVAARRAATITAGMVERHA